MCDVIEINGTKYVPASQQANSVDGMKPVLIRSYGSGVHFGLLKDEKFTEAGKVVTLANSRRVHYWAGSASLSQMSVDGIGKPDDSRVSMMVEEIEVVQVIETIPLTESAFTNLQQQPVWKV